MELCGDLALSEHQNDVPQVGLGRKVLLTILECVTNFFRKNLRVTIIYQIALCLPIDLV